MRIQMKHTYTLHFGSWDPEKCVSSCMHEEIGSHQQTTEGEARYGGMGDGKESALTE